VAADLGGVFDGLQPGGQRLPLGILSEVVVRAAGGDDEGVEGDLFAVRSEHELGRRVEAADFGQQGAGVPLAFENAAERGGDVRRGE
jgi:hypothetical protein